MNDEPGQPKSTSAWKKRLKQAAYFVTGFCACYVVGFYVFGFLNISNYPVETLVNADIKDLLTSNWHYLVILSCLAGIVVMVIGKRRIPLYWLWFFIAFGLICVLPVMPQYAGVNYLGINMLNDNIVHFYLIDLPLLFKLCLLLFHIVLTMLVAWGLFSIWPGEDRPFFCDELYCVE